MEQQGQKLCEETNCPAQGTAKRPVWLEQSEAGRMCEEVRWEKWAEQVTWGLIVHHKNFEIYTMRIYITLKYILYILYAPGSLGRECVHVCVYVWDVSPFTGRLHFSVFSGHHSLFSCSHSGVITLVGPCHSPTTLLTWCLFIPPPLIYTGGLLKGQH